MQDYSQIYLDAMQTLKSFYNHELKNNHVEAAKSAKEASILADKLKDIANDRARV